MRALALIIALLAAPAAAADFDAPPQVTIRTDKAKDGGAVHAELYIAAPPEVVWEVLADCAHAPRIMPKLISCKILEADPAGRWDVREHRVRGNMFKPVLHSVFRTELERGVRLAFHRVSGDWKRSEGEWNLRAVPGGTHVTYDIRAEIDAPIPKSMARRAVARNMPEALLALRAECLKEKARQAAGG